MKSLLLSCLLVLLLAGPLVAQGVTEAEIRRNVPFATLKAQIPDLTWTEYNRVVAKLARIRTQQEAPELARQADNERSPRQASPYVPYRQADRRKIPSRVQASRLWQASEDAQQALAEKPLGHFSANPYLSDSTSNPYATNTPRLYGADGKYLGKLSTNPYDPDSIANPYGRYGNPYSPDSVNNPFGRYGSPYSPYSATNPYATKPPVIKEPKR